MSKLMVVSVFTAMLAMGTTTGVAQLPYSAPRHATADYELYAPDDMDISALQAGVELAIARWKEYYDAVPGQLSLVVFTDPQAAAGTDLSALRRDGRLPIPWVHDERKPTRGHGALPHELCHVFYIRHVDAYRRANGVQLPEKEASTPISYGARAVPDWYDEAIATRCETEGLQNDRRLQTSDVDLIPLERLLTMTHPAFAGTVEMLQKMGIDLSQLRPGAVQVETRGANPGAISEIRAIRPEAGTMIAGDQSDIRAFYPQVLVFGDFLVERGGSGLIRRIGDAFAALRPIEEVLRAEPSLPDDVATLAAEWAAWLRHH